MQNYVIYPLLYDMIWGRSGESRLIKPSPSFSVGLYDVFAKCFTAGGKIETYLCFQVEFYVDE